MVLDGLVVLPEAEVGVAEVAQVVALALPVSDLAGDGQRLVVVLDGLVVLPKVAVGDAEVAQVAALALPVSISREMASAWLWCSMALSYCPRLS